MSTVLLTRIWLENGYLNATLSDNAPNGDVELVVTGQIEAVTSPSGTPRSVQFALPTARLSEGVTTLVLRMKGQEDVLGSFPILSGSVLAEDMAVEVAQLRMELELMKAYLRSGTMLPTY